MSETGGRRIRVTLRWLQILDKMEPFFKEKGEFAFLAKVSTDNHGGQVQETRIPRKGHYSVSDHPRWNRLNGLDKVIFEGEVTDHLRVEIQGAELDWLSPNDPLELYSRTFEGPIADHLARFEPGDEGSEDPENLSNWRLGYEIEAL